MTDDHGGVFAAAVTRNALPFTPRRSLRLRSHSPCGFEWGYGGSGPAQLALALILDVTGDAALALRTYQWFKWAVVVNWGERWQITAAQVRLWLIQAMQETPHVHEPAVEPEHVAEGGAA